MVNDKTASADRKSQNVHFQNQRKRKDAPDKPRNEMPAGKRPRIDNRKQSMWTARTIATQTASKAFKNGEVDVDKFIKTREYEICALEKGLRDSKKVLSQRAFQQVPKELRRRTASHNVKKIPKRLRERARREIAEDNTPVGKARRTKQTTRQRLRVETARRLRVLGSKQKAMNGATKGAEKENAKQVEQRKSDASKGSDTCSDTQNKALKTRPPKTKKASLAHPPVPKAKFRKRQRNKTWLPTHLFHAKRAHISAPSDPLWRFSIPLTPTGKSYRPTHRAASERGCVCWDTSYMATLSLGGRESSILNVLRQLDLRKDLISTRTGGKWLQGLRVWEGWLFGRETKTALAPVAIIWRSLTEEERAMEIDGGERKRHMLIRVHPSAFKQLWDELARVVRVVKPEVRLEDLRFEIGSIEVVGPASTEALVGALCPSMPADAPQTATHSVEAMFRLLASLNNPAALPEGALLSFDIQDPRLHHPPRVLKTPKTTEQHDDLLRLLVSWPVDTVLTPAGIFDRQLRVQATARLASQKAIHRRRTLAPAGEYPVKSSTDPNIPVLLYSTRFGKKLSHQAKWTMLLPWKCVQPAWYSLNFYPMSTGGRARFGCLREQQQVALERGEGWFPGDMPGTDAGWEWEIMERKRRFLEWKSRPKGKRIAFDKAKLGNGQVGEIGTGWCCDWERLLDGRPAAESESATHKHSDSGDKTGEKTHDPESALPPPKPRMLHQIPPYHAQMCLKGGGANFPGDLDGGVANVRILLLSRGVPQTCARVYRLPSNADNSGSAIRKAWLDLHPTNRPQKREPKHGLPRISYNDPPHIVQRRLAESLLDPPRAGEDQYPICPTEEDLVGFVTSGNFNLAEGHGTAIGCLLLKRIIDQPKGEGRVDERALCVVRNAGQSVGRLAEWELA